MIFLPHYMRAENKNAWTHVVYTKNASHLLQIGNDIRSSITSTEHRVVDLTLTNCSKASILHELFPSYFFAGGSEKDYFDTNNSTQSFQ